MPPPTTRSRGRPAQGRPAQSPTARSRTSQSRTAQRRTTGRRPAPRRRRRADPARRIEFILFGSLIMLSLVGGRLVQLQGLDRTAYAAMAEKQRLRVVELSAHRGAIIDRDGQPLAETIAARDVYADPTKVADPALEARLLAPVLGMKATDLQDQLEADGATDTFRYLARAVSTRLAARVMELRLPGTESGSLPGIGVLPATKRIYPAGDLASNVVGFANTDGEGLAGLEYSFQDMLAGHPGKRTFETGLVGSPIPDGQEVIEPAVPGTGLRLTIQRDIQWRAQQAIAAQVEAVHADSGTVIVMNPRTGELLALAVSPGYDPNDPSASPVSAFGDPAISDVYEPGSVNKVITMSAALEEKLVRPTTPFTIPPLLHYAGFTFHDAEEHGTERLTLAGVLAKSSNIGTIQVARKVGAPKLYHYLRAYGFGQPTGVRLPGDGTGLLPKLRQWSDSTLPTVAFGQGVGVTALQVASVYATIANGGIRVTPNLVAGRIGPDGTLTPEPKPEQHRVITARTAQQVSDMLEAVTSNEGTAPLARIPGYRIAGKTGTAQRPNNNGGYSGYTASFVGYAPADDPKLLVSVVLQNPRSGHFGGLVAAPVFQKVMAFALQTLRIPPTGTRPPSVRLTW